MSLTRIASKIFLPRQKELDRYNKNAVALQWRTLSNIVSEAQDTEYGRNHMFASINSYHDFANNVPVNTYEELKNDIDRMRHGESDVLWNTSWCLTWKA